jgi:hypothetical protein
MRFGALRLKYTFGCAGLLVALAACTGSTVPAVGAGQSPQASSADATRFLEQSSFGPTDTELARVRGMGIAAYLGDQFSKQATGYPGYSYASPDMSVGCPDGSPSTCGRDKYTIFQVQRQFFQNTLTGSDQLRQRVALALSQILVVSGLRVKQPYAMAAYQQLLLDDAFGNYRSLLDDVTLSPAMGYYLDMVNNNKAGSGTGANENYARELMQLFSIGVTLLNSDGTPQLDNSGQPIPSYTQDTVENFAKVFTGWTFPPMPGANAQWTDPIYFQGQMAPIEAHHDTTAKVLLGGTAVPAGGTAESDLKIALDNIFNHPNVGPFIGKQLIQHLVTSNPSPAYVQRVAAVFANDGHGVRGNLQAVVQQILLDPEARGDSKVDSAYGKLREPALFIPGLLRTIGGTSDGVYPLAAGASLEQGIFNAPSVFNFYPPGYTLIGTGTNGVELSGPPFAIYDANSSMNRVNVLNTLLSATNGIPADSSVAGATGTRLDLSAWQAAAADAAGLADKINQSFFHGAMPSDMQALLVQDVNAIPSSDPLGRARMALYLALGSDQYQVEQ